MNGIPNAQYAGTFLPGALRHTFSNSHAQNVAPDCTTEADGFARSEAREWLRAVSLRPLVVSSATDVHQMLSACVQLPGDCGCSKSINLNYETMLEAEGRGHAAQNPGCHNLTRGTSKQETGQVARTLKRPTRTLKRDSQKVRTRLRFCVFRIWHPLAQ